MKNKNLNIAKHKKDDEFYTTYEEVERELNCYSSRFENKIVYCNCDDADESNFVKYFLENFERLKIKKLLVTGFSVKGGKQDFKFYRMTNGGGVGTLEKDENESYEVGDFRSSPCVSLLKQADIVVTNPPFSLFKEHLLLNVLLNKDFLVIGNENSTSYKEIFAFFKTGEIHFGIHKPKEFLRPDGTTTKLGNVVWFTNMTPDKKYQKEKLTPDASYLAHKENYPHYDNYDAINVDNVKDVPCDYDGTMGVPLSILYRYDLSDYDIIGMTHMKDTMDKPVKFGEKFVKKYREQGGTGNISPGMYGVCYYDKNGKAKYPFGRVLIRKKSV